MHGRNTKTPVWPIIVPKEKILENLETIAELIKEYNPDIVTLQEVDMHSLSTEKFDQLEKLNSILNYPYFFYGDHFHTPVGIFGTAILSKFPLHNTLSQRFPITFPTPRKGFILSDIEVAPGKLVTVSSLHTTWLNILYPNTRRLQLQKIFTEMTKRANNPLIISGDYNDTIHNSTNTTLSDFIHSSRLKAYEKDSEDFKTHPSNNPALRIDWILVSPLLTFKTYETLQVHYSDHLSIFSVIALSD